MTTATATHICEACGVPFAPHPKTSKRFCAKPQCKHARNNESRARGAANQPGRRNAPTPAQRAANAAVFVKDEKEIIPPPWKKGQFTDDEFDKEYASIRLELDSKPPGPRDLHWRRADITRKVRTDWTVGQMARWYGVPYETMQRLVDAVKGVDRD